MGVGVWDEGEMNDWEVVQSSKGPVEDHPVKMHKVVWESWYTQKMAVRSGWERVRWKMAREEAEEVSKVTL
jgi:hypothetical protein